MFQSSTKDHVNKNDEFLFHSEKCAKKYTFLGAAACLWSFTLKGTTLYHVYP